VLIENNRAYAISINSAKKGAFNHSQGEQQKKTTQQLDSGAGDLKLWI
jgi:hypothetical protein